MTIFLLLFFALSLISIVLNIQKSSPCDDDLSTSWLSGLKCSFQNITLAHLNWIVRLHQRNLVDLNWCTGCSNLNGKFVIPFAGLPSNRFLLPEQLSRRFFLSLQPKIALSCVVNPCGPLLRSKCSNCGRWQTVHLCSLNVIRQLHQFAYGAL